jgi:Nucleotidyltransferase domain
VDAVLLVGSCARGWADEGSDLDLAVVVTPSVGEAERQALLRAWEASGARAEAAHILRPLVRYSDVEIDLIDGKFQPTPRGWTSGPDEFELELGNYVAHSTVLFERDARVQTLRDRWLPFYEESLRTERLKSVRTYCLNNLDHVPWALGRGDRFHAFHRLYHASQEFLQALFISRRTYPLAYDKWVAKQLGELLGLAELAPELETIVGARQLDAAMLRGNAGMLAELLDEYAGAEAGA